MTEAPSIAAVSTTTTKSRRRLQRRSAHISFGDQNSFDQKQPFTRVMTCFLAPASMLATLLLYVILFCVSWIRCVMICVLDKLRHDMCMCIALSIVPTGTCAPLTLDVPRLYLYGCICNQKHWPHMCYFNSLMVVHRLLRK